jgi:hypothetical protein
MLPILPFRIARQFKVKNGTKHEPRELRLHKPTFQKWSLVHLFKSIRCSINVLLMYHIATAGVIICFVLHAPVSSSPLQILNLDLPTTIPRLPFPISIPSTFISLSVFSTNCTASRQTSLPTLQPLSTTPCASRILFARCHLRFHMSSFLLTGTLLLELGLYDSSSEVSVLFQDMRLVIVLIVEPVVLRGNGGGGGSEDELLEETSD